MVYILEDFKVYRVNEEICRSEKSQGQRGHRKVICQALVIINLYIKFNVHSSYAKQVIVLNVAGRLDGQTHLVTTTA